MLNIQQKKCQNAIVLANAVEVITRVIKNIAGNDISNSLNGSTITNEIITSLAMQRINSQIKNK